jgi:hypothetical protein
MVCVQMAGDQNTWVYRPQPETGFNPIPTSFRAAIGGIGDIQGLLQPENQDLIFNVSTRFLAGGLFTGNDFIAIPLVERLWHIGAQAEYDVVQNPAIYRYKATANEGISGTGRGLVKISFVQEVRNLAQRTPTCIQVAQNDTGRPLTDGQNLWVEWTQDGWHITDFECN